VLCNRNEERCHCCHWLRNYEDWPSQEEIVAIIMFVEEWLLKNIISPII
jgi:hypothetical protein